MIILKKFSDWTELKFLDVSEAHVVLEVHLTWSRYQKCSNLPIPKLEINAQTCAHNYFNFPLKLKLKLANKI